MQNSESTTQLMRMGNSDLNLGRNDHDYQERDDGAEDLPEAWLDEETSPGSIGNHRPPPKIPEAAGHVNIHELNTFAENAGKLPIKTQISVTSHMAMVDIITAPLLDGICSEQENHPHMFPPHSTITYFLQLFFVYVHPRFPVLHVRTFDPNSVPPILLLAMAISGSSYSESNKSKFALTYLARARLSIRLMQERDQNYVSSLKY
ncbi:C2H2 type zinc finger domain protein [Penicillium malachiteum]|uniref:C2H2 type zinc finger domain protein n=1 Tax=Penicillium malachiteum TaxID=1324776 RepID=A0AAD6HU14_9EURO|nr:C2H2 type zinc finger domain protein [Penicillium malachiteum]